MPTNRGGDHEAVYRCYCYCELVAGRASHGHVLESVIRGDPQHKRLVKGHGAGVFSEAEIRCATDLRPAWRAAAHKGQAANDPFDDAYQAGFWIHLHEDRYVRQDNDSKLYRGQRNADWTNTTSLLRQHGPWYGGGTTPREGRGSAHMKGAATPVPGGLPGLGKKR
jgi:hypothetical protein